MDKDLGHVEEMSKRLGGHSFIQERDGKTWRRHQEGKRKLLFGFETSSIYVALGHGQNHGTLVIQCDIQCDNLKKKNCKEDFFLVA